LLLRPVGFPSSFNARTRVVATLTAVSPLCIGRHACISRQTFLFWKALRSETGERPGLEYVAVVENQPFPIVRPPSAALHR
jgi:hypothetical protein